MNEMDHSYQLEIERLYNKNQLIPRIVAEFKESGFVPELERIGMDPEFGLHLLAQMVVHKRATIPTLVGLLGRFFPTLQACSDGIQAAVNAGMVTWNPGLQVCILVWDMSADVKADLERFQYPLPMSIRPREVRNNTETGYLTIKNSVILKNNHHEDDVCLDHINRMNSIKLTVNSDVVTMVKNEWRNLDHPKPDEDVSEYTKRVKAFEKYDASSKDVLGLFEITGSTMYLTHKYDKRGRTYCQGYHVTYQGNPWNKAVLEFVNQEVTNG